MRSSVLMTFKDGNEVKDSESYDTINISVHNHSYTVVDILYQEVAAKKFNCLKVHLVCEVVAVILLPESLVQKVM